MAMLPPTELMAAADLLHRIEADLRKARAPKTLIARAAEAHLAIQWLVDRRKK